MTFNTLYYFFLWLCVYKHIRVDGQKILRTLAVARLSSIFVQITHKGHIRSLLADTLHKSGPSHKEKQQYQVQCEGKTPSLVWSFSLCFSTLSSLRLFSLCAEASCSWISLENLKFSLKKLCICYLSSELSLTFLCCLCNTFVIDCCIPIIIPAVLHICLPYMHITIFLVPLVTGLNAKSQIYCDISSAQIKM